MYIVPFFWGFVNPKAGAMVDKPAEKRYNIVEEHTDEIFGNSDSEMREL